MKVVALLFGLLMMVSCKKDILSNTIIGTWELRTAIGGWTGAKQYAPRNGNLVIFNEKNQYTQKVVNADTSYTLLYKYSLVKENDCGRNLILETGTDNGNLEQRAIISHDTLTILDACVVYGGSAIYIRQ